MQPKASSVPPFGATGRRSTPCSAGAVPTASSAASHAWVLGCTLALVALGCGAGPMPASVAHPLVGIAAPEFQVESTSARFVGVPGSRRTRVTILDFWASWCPACGATLPALDAIWREHKADGVMVIGVSVDDSVEAADAGAHELGASFPIVADAAQHLAGTYGVAQVPLTFVLDGAGTVRWVGRDPESVRRAVDVLLSQGPDARPRSVFE